MNKHPLYGGCLFLGRRGEIDEWVCRERIYPFRKTQKDIVGTACMLLCKDVKPPIDKTVYIL